ncbi:MAG: DinB family protein [Chitinophagaceae bacterium]|nr:DinB family protein [Chitinophagaceae bacterium]
MILTIEQFLGIWDQETESTLAVFKHLTDEALSKNLLHGYRTIERTVNHITDCAISIPHAATVPVAYTKQHYTTVKQLLDAYSKNTEAVRAAVSGWTDTTLQEKTPMYGESWTKAFALWVTIVHQIHHRGQLTVLMRMAGLKVHGVYGPAKEEWEAMNFPQAD